MNLCSPNIPPRAPPLQIYWCKCGKELLKICQVDLDKKILDIEFLQCPRCGQKYYKK